MLLNACGNSPTEPDRPNPLSVTCPPNQAVQSPDGNPVGVSFNAPQTVGGTGTATTSCTPPSGSQFPVGTSTVACQARDAAGQTASCTFTVLVQGAPRLAVTRFLGIRRQPDVRASYRSRHRSSSSSPPGSYPFQLQDRLVTAYRQQMPVVLNEGNPGELASVMGVERFRSVLLANRPDVVLLMEGTNDLLFGEPGGNAAINALRAMVREAKSQAVRIMLATIPPQRAGGIRNRDAVVRLIPGFNDRVRGLATTEGIPLVDVFAGMQGDNTLIGIDDLHMTVRGYEVMAGIYFDAIKANYEVRPATTALERTRAR